MCQHCDYQHLLGEAGLDSTPNRLQVLEAVGANTGPLTAGEIFDIVERNQSINRVTVYRILDLLVEKNLLERLSGGGRVAYYGLAPNEHHAPHPHFYCRLCGQLECLREGSISIDTELLRRTFAGAIERVEIRVDGVCRNCLKQLKNH